MVRRVVLVVPGVRACRGRLFARLGRQRLTPTVSRYLCANDVLRTIRDRLESLSVVQAACTGDGATPGAVKAPSGKELHRSVARSRGKVK